MWKTKQSSVASVAKAGLDTPAQMVIVDAAHTRVLLS